MAHGRWIVLFLSRQYGIGVDQVVEFDVVMVNGTQTKVDACSNPDLFWALRGGGGGTFGVVTHVQYKLHPVTEIQEINFVLYGFENLKKEEDINLFITAIIQWIDHWIKESPTLDTRRGGFFSISHAHLLFVGSMEDARATFLDDFEKWVKNELVNSNNPALWGAWVDTKSHDNWYEYKGGEEAKGNPDATDQTGAAYENINVMAARLVPEDVVVNRGSDMLEFLLSEDIASNLGYVNYFLGGNINKVGIEETSVHPALRSSIWSLFTVNENANQKVREFLPNDITGVCYNHHNPTEPDWRNVSASTSTFHLGHLQ